MVKCNTCGDTGIVPVECVITFPECCGVPHSNGECCGDPVQGFEQVQEPAPCPECYESEENNNND